MAGDGQILELDLAVSRMTAASAVVLKGVAEVDRPEIWRRDGATSTTSWLAARYNVLWGVAGEGVRVARALRGLPCVSLAYAKTELSWEQRRPLTKCGDAESAAHWAEAAASWSPAALW